MVSDPPLRYLRSLLTPWSGVCRRGASSIYFTIWTTSLLSVPPTLLSVVRHFRSSAPSKRRTYDTAMRRFRAFSERYQITDPFPVTEFLLCTFTASLADDGLAPQTVKSYLAAIRNTQLSLGLPDPRDHSSLPVLKRVLAGIHRTRLNRGQPPRVRLPITATLLRRIKGELLRTANPERHVLWAGCCTAFFGFFRLGELLQSSQAQFNPRLHLSWGDMAVNNARDPKMLKFHLRQSKTDQSSVQ